MRQQRVLLTLMGLEIGGAETHVVELAKGLINKGYFVVVASNGGVYEKELKDFGAIHYKLPLHNKKPHNMIKSLFALKKIIKAEKIDLVHAHARIPAFLCGILHKTMKIPFVTTAHGVFVTGWGLKYITNWGTKSLAVSEDIKKYLMNEYDISERNITVTINGIDTKRFTPDMDTTDIIEEFKIDKSKKHIVYISRLENDRTIVAYQLMEVLPQIRDYIHDYEVVIVGSGNDFENIKQKAEQINGELGERKIILTGGRTDVNKFTALADIFVGVSRAVLEAMAAEKPVIMAAKEGYTGIFDEDKLKVSIQTNFTCRGERSSEAALLKADIIKLIQMSEEQRKELGLFGKEIVKERYSVQKMVQDNIDVYNMILAEENNHTYDAMISGYYGFKNSGDDAILLAMINQLKEVKKDARIVVLSMNPSETKKVYGVDAINRFDIFSIIKKMKNTKLLINGGGSLIQDITSTRSLYYYLAIIKLAKAMKLKVMLYANGIGPIKDRNREITSKVLNCVDTITLREEESMKEIEVLGVQKPTVRITADPALTLTPADQDTVDLIFKAEKIDCSKSMIGFSVRSWSNSDKYASVIARVADYLVEKYGVMPVFIPMQHSKDLAIIKLIMSKMEHKSCYIKYKYNVSGLLGIIKKMDLIIGMRLHALIYAACVNVPMVGLVYEPKVEGFLKQVNQISAGNVEDLDFEKFKKQIDNIWEKRSEYAGKLEDKVTELKKTTLQNTLIALELIKEKKDITK